MKLFSIENNKVKSLSTNPFEFEKDIQKLVEQNLEELFHLQFVKSEFSIKNFRIDTLAFNKETKTFVIIEYKKERNFSVIDQGYTYMSLMFNNKSDFILEYNESCAASLKREDVDWSQARVLFVSPYFTDYQKHSINFKDVPFELWEIKRYENNLLGMVQHKNDSKESIVGISGNPENIVSKVSTEVKVWTEEYHLNASKSSPEWVNELYFNLKDRLKKLNDVELKATGKYISFRYNSSPFVDFVFYNNGLYTIINLKEGNLKDPNKIMNTFNGKGHWGNGDYYTIVNRKTDLDYLMSLINQSYQSKG